MDGSLEFRRPDGRSLPHVLAPPATPRDPARALALHHEALGLQIHPRTACPTWLGERLDIGWALSVLHPEVGAHDPDRPS
jgi:hypothetical protein